jgi:hypothetical protein
MGDFIWLNWVRKNTTYMTFLKQFDGYLGD